MVKHHLADMKEEINRRLEELERVSNRGDTVRRARKGVLNWGRDTQAREPVYEEKMDELKLLVREFEVLICDRREYLGQEISRLQKLLSKQKEHNNQKSTH